MNDLAIFILRVVIGVVMLVHGIYQFQKKAFFDKKWKEEYGFPQGSVLLNGVVQILGSLALFTGIFTSHVAIVLTLNIIVGMYVCIWNHRKPFLSTPEVKGWNLHLKRIV